MRPSPIPSAVTRTRPLSLASSRLYVGMSWSAEAACDLLFDLASSASAEESGSPAIARANEAAKYRARR